MIVALTKPKDVLHEVHSPDAHFSIWVPPDARKKSHADTRRSRSGDGRANRQAKRVGRDVRGNLLRNDRLRRLADRIAARSSRALRPSQHGNRKKLDPDLPCQSRQPGRLSTNLTSAASIAILRIRFKLWCKESSIAPSRGAPGVGDQGKLPPGFSQASLVAPENHCCSGGASQLGLKLDKLGCSFRFLILSFALVPEQVGTSTSRSPRPEKLRGR